MKPPFEQHCLIRRSRFSRGQPVCLTTSYASSGVPRMRLAPRASFLLILVSPASRRQAAAAQGIERERERGIEREMHGMGRVSASRLAGQTTTLCRTRSLAARATLQAFSAQFRATLPLDCAVAGMETSIEVIVDAASPAANASAQT